MRHLAVPLASRGLAAALAVLFLASGCGTSSSAKKDIVFPEPPDKPRIRFVRRIKNEEDLGQSAWKKFVNAILPHDSSNGIVSPTSLAFSPDERILYVAMPHRKRVVAIDLEARSFSALGASGRTPLMAPVGVGVDGDGLVYVSDKATGNVVVFDKSGEIVRRFGKEQLVEPTGLAVDRRNQIVYVVNDAARQGGRHCVEAYSLAGKHLRTLGGVRSAEPGSFNFPRSVAVSRAGELHVVDMLNFRVQVFDPAGRLMRSYGKAGAAFPGSFDKIHAVAFDKFDNVYVADAVQGVHILNADAKPLMMFGPPISRAPSSIAIDSKNRIFVGDLLHAVYEFELINTTAEDSRPKRPASPAGQSASPAAAR